MYTNLTDLPGLDAESIVKLLQDRYDEQKIFTDLGNNVVMKVNPFEDVSLSNENNNIGRLAKEAFVNAVSTGFPQSCQMSGESGSGKTEATKSYLKALTEHSVNESLHIQLTDSCTLLESFGNCGTEHNHNSSRFARWFALTVCRTSKKIVSGHVHQYLLEKARVTSSSSGSTNFHVLYDICESFDFKPDPTTVEQRSSHFNYLKARGGTGQRKRWQRMLQQLGHLGVTEDEMTSVERLLWCVLHLGQLQFEFNENTNCCELTSESKHSLRCIGVLLGVPDLDTVGALFMTKKLKCGKQVITQQRTAEQAVDARDALARDLYRHLFVWVVEKINNSIHKPAPKNSTQIGLLDIFGFECFDSNSFEQLCINYCNEKLVQQFHNVLVKTEVEVCKAEGVAAGSVGLEAAYEKEQERKRFVLGGIDKVFTIIQDEIRVPKSTDVTLNVKLLKLGLGEMTNKTKMAGSTTFTINHYAGLVSYETKGFLEKNRDEGPVDIAEMLCSESSNKFIVALYKKQPTSTGAKKKKTAGVKFRDEFALLSKTLQASEQQFVMCMKPNRQAKARLFDEGLVERQLECNGTLTICRVRASAFAVHLPMSEFVDRYGLLLPDAVSRDSASMKTYFVSSEEAITDNDIFVGKTRVLLRESARNALNEQLELMSSQVVLMQAFLRGSAACRKYAQTRSAVITAQSTVRRYLARREMETKREQFTSIVRVQSVVRRHQAKARFVRAAAAVVLIQSTFRRYLARVKVHYLLREPSTVMIQSMVRARLLHGVVIARIAVRKRLCRFREERSAVKIQSFSRMILDQKVAKKLRRTRSASVQSAAIVIQCFVRLKVFRSVRMARLCIQKRVALVKWRKEQASAVLIQSCARMFLAKRACKKALAEKTKRKIAAAAASTAVVAAGVGAGAAAAAPEGYQEDENNNQEDTKKQEVEKSEKKKRMMAAAAAGLAATAGIATGAVLLSSKQEQPASPSLSNDTLLSRPTIPKGRRRPSKRSPTSPARNVAGGAAVTQTAGVAAVATAASPVGIKQQQQEKPGKGKLEENPAEHRGSDEEDVTEAKPKEALGREDEGDAKQAPAEGEGNGDPHSEQSKRDSYFFNKNSSTFVKMYGQLEEDYYADVAKQVPEYSHLNIELPPAKHAPPSIDDLPLDVPKKQARLKLLKAIEKREFHELASALVEAVTAGYNGSEVEKAHLIAKFIRKTHIKQMEAEKVFARRFMNNNV